ncbi:D-mandelate dehydrogenase-like dehydrogenase [Aspergillus mulundensis]|uniref:D-mandelate dehydrogenase n=1 Tax=Aspergillus mulundensis TaxID=1810919 RepID=A0A3D8RK41_9EURO|nr:hypothetical protein DSM5745_07071 [Aspergillus mulundensis]RDW74409.1 hypothetical protein DSM5745_07071 [Aspergillus mulundensis]
MSTTKPTILHLGDPIKYNPDLYTTFSTHFTVLRPPTPERTRESFKTALRENRYGSFTAILRPFWNTGGEMGKWDKELIDLLPKSVRIFASAGAGFDWVDTGYLAEKGIIYCNGAAASSESVADMALFLILASFRNLAWSHNAAISQNPRAFLDAHQNSPLTARNPRGHTLGIIGLGQIGLTIAKKVHAAFGMKILYHDIVRKPTEVERSIDGTFYATLDDMLAESDCVVVATPFAGETLLTREVFGKFKRGSRFVNIARGSLVDEEAVLGALEDGTLVGVGMDVHADEPNVHPRLARHPRVMMMSHNAGGTVDTHIGFERLAMENILAFFREGRALTPVNAHLVRSRSVL